MGNLNRVIFQAINSLSHRNAFLDGADVFFAQYVPYLMLLGFFILLFYQRDTRARLYFFAEAAIATVLSRGIITETIRFFYHHARPEGALGIQPLIPAAGWSFPSAHATFYFALAMVVFYANRRWGEWFLVGAAFIAIARVYAGAHWPLDVIAGAAIGIVCAMLVRRLLRPYRAALPSYVP